MALSAPSPPSGPTGPIPPSPNVLVYQFTTPRPGTYQINAAIGDALNAVTGQQLQLYDGATLLATLFTNIAAPADNYIDAQGNVLSASNWVHLNAPVFYVFQTTAVVFYIGDGVHHTYVSSLQVQDAVQVQTVLVPRVRSVLRPHRKRRLFQSKRYVLAPMPLPIQSKMHPVPVLRVKRRKPWARKRQVYPYGSISVYHVPLRVRRPTVVPRRRKWRMQKHLALPRIIQPTPPYSRLQYHPLRPLRPKRRKWFFRASVHRGNYPTPAVVQTSGAVLPGRRLVIVVN